MKDPLQIEKTPYEILNVDEVVDDEKIFEAFKNSIEEPDCNIEKIRGARNTLAKTTERAFVNVFLYKERYLNKLVPNVISNNSYLLDKRKDTAESWLNINRKTFPNIASIHSLAVLWYWWAIYYENKQLSAGEKTSSDKKNLISNSFPIDTIWSNIISNWVFITKSKDFWCDFFNADECKWIVGNLDTYSLCLKLESKFTNIFNSFIEKYRNQGDTKSVERFREYELMLSNEKSTAEEMYNMGINITKEKKSFPIYFGRMMLEQVGLLSEVQEQVKKFVRVNPDRKVKSIVKCLSESWAIAGLIDGRKYDEAIQMIKNLPSKERSKKEVIELLASAYYKKGKQYFSLDNYKDAKSCWKEAVKSGGASSEIKEGIIKSCSSKAASLQNSDRDTAIEILELALEIVTDEGLKKVLSNIYVQRGVVNINKAINGYKENKVTQKSVRESIEKGIKDIKKAVELNPTNSFANEQLRNAGAILKDIEMILKESKLPTDVMTAIKGKQWEYAISKLKAILNREPKNKPAKEFMALCCNALAMDKYNIDKDIDGAEKLLNTGLKYNPGNKVLKKNLAVMINSNGVKLLNEALDLISRKEDPMRVLLLFEEAKKFFKEAIKLDSSNEIIKKNLSNTDQFLSKIPGYGTRQYPSYSQNNYSYRTYSTRSKRPSFYSIIVLIMGIVGIFIFAFGGLAILNGIIDLSVNRRTSTKTSKVFDIIGIILGVLAIILWMGF